MTPEIIEIISSASDEGSASPKFKHRAGMLLFCDRHTRSIFMTTHSARRPPTSVRKLIVINSDDDAPPIDTIISAERPSLRVDESGAIVISDEEDAQPGILETTSILPAPAQEPVQRPSPLLIADIIAQEGESDRFAGGLTEHQDLVEERGDIYMPAFSGSSPDAATSGSPTLQDQFEGMDLDPSSGGEDSMPKMAAEPEFFTIHSDSGREPLNPRNGESTMSTAWG